MIIPRVLDGQKGGYRKGKILQAKGRYRLGFSVMTVSKVAEARLT